MFFWRKIERFPIFTKLEVEYFKWAKVRKKVQLKYYILKFL